MKGTIKPTGTLLMVLGLIVCVVGGLTLGKDVMLPAEELDQLQITPFKIWPAYIIVIFTIGYIAWLGRSFFFKA